MTSPTPRLSVCIPAFNEEGGIGRLLREILTQEHRYHRLTEVLVISDGSTDATAAIARHVPDSRIHVMDDGQRCGKSARVNQVFAAAAGDIIVLLDADVVLPDSRVLDTLVRDFRPREHGLAAPAVHTLPSTCWLDRSLAVGAAIVADLGAAWRPEAGNYLQFRGCCLVVGREFARRVQIPTDVVNDDCFLYLSALQLGYHPRALPRATVGYLLPTNLRDHRGQSARHRWGAAELVRWFPADVVRREYAIPRRLKLRAVVRHARRDPAHLLGYLLIQVASSVSTGPHGEARWTPATTTKPRTDGAVDHRSTARAGRAQP